MDFLDCIRGVDRLDGVCVSAFTVCSSLNVLEGC